ncbi:MAG: hypothetical protein QOJ15_11579 [Bradyrhizobium sp.]|jgi:hypothetical protein|nr:hypothetical protein [Bradyrhizobium sp.]
MPNGWRTPRGIRGLTLNLLCLQWSAPARDGIKMRLSEIERIAKAAMDACAEVINHPADSFARERLFNSLAEVVDPAFVETDQSRRDSFNHLLQQANVWGAIVRQRIDLFQRAGPGATTAPSIRYPTRDLQHILDALLYELGGLPAVPSSSRITRQP